MVTPTASISVNSSPSCDRTFSTRIEYAYCCCMVVLKFWYFVSGTPQYSSMILDCVTLVSYHTTFMVATRVYSSTANAGGYYCCAL